MKYPPPLLRDNDCRLFNPRGIVCFVSMDTEAVLSYEYLFDLCIYHMNNIIIINRFGVAKIIPSAIGADYRHCLPIFFLPFLTSLYFPSMNH